MVPVLLRAGETAAAQFQLGHAEAFVQYLGTLRVAPNGHPQSATRPLLDKGIQFILETCRSLFVFAGKRRHLSPYADNPFSALELGRLRIEHRRPILLPEGTDVAALLTWFAHRITNALSEGFNSVIQNLKANARGFRNFRNYRTRLLFFCGKFDLKPAEYPAA